MSTVAGFVSKGMEVALTERAAPRMVQPSAYLLMRATVYAGFAMIPVSILAIALAVFDFRLFVTNWWIAVMFVILVASVRLCAIGADLQAVKELDRGYTSLLRFGNEVDVRDPRDGRLVRVAGQPFRRARNMKLMRERATDFASAPDSIPMSSDAESSIIREQDLKSEFRPDVRAVIPTRPNRRVWMIAMLILLATTFAVRQLIFASQTSWNLVLVGILIALVIVGLVLGLPTLVSGQTMQSRVARIRAGNPGAFVVPAVRTVSLVGLISRIAPGAIVQVDQVWVFDSTGCSLWLEKPTTERALHIPWALAQTVERVPTHSDRGNTYPAVAIKFKYSNNTESATFFPRRAGALTLFKMSTDGVDSVVREIQLRHLRATGTNAAVSRP